MSILNGARINFWGGIRSDVSLPNNSPTIPYSGGTLNLFNIATSTLARQAESYTDDQLNEMINAPSGDYYTAGGWNHYGQHVVDMQNVLVSSQGTPGAISTRGDLVDKPVYLLGSVDPVTQQGPVSGPMMVDLDPTSSVTTQIVVGGLQIGSSSSPELLIRFNTSCNSQDLALRIIKGESDAPGSNRFSGTFQLTFPLSSVVSYNHNSPILTSMIEAPGATGLVLRFVMFEMCPQMTTDQLNADYAAGTDSPNPSIGRVIGTLASTFDDEPQICQAGRLLINQSTGSAGYMAVHNNLMSLDMVNLLPKAEFRAVRDDITSPIGPNINYGTLAFSAGGTPLGSLDCNSDLIEAYYIYGGLADLPLSSDQQQALKNSPLTITGENPTTHAKVDVQEQLYRIYTDQRNIYLDDYDGSIAVTLNLRYLGQVVQQSKTIKVVSGDSGELPSPDYLSFPAEVTVAAKQPSVTLQVSAKSGSSEVAGFEQLSYHCDTSSYFSNFRKFSQTDFGIPAGSTISWEQVYQYVLRFHYLAFPAMSRFIPLNQPDAIMTHANSIIERTSDAYKSTTLYMPVVRSMSPSQVALLAAYLTGKPWLQS